MATCVKLTFPNDRIFDVELKKQMATESEKLVYAALRFCITTVPLLIKSALLLLLLLLFFYPKMEFEQKALKTFKNVSGLK